MSEVSNRQDAVKSPSRTVAGDRFSALVVAIFRLNARLVEIGDAMAAPSGQTTTRWQILAAADDAPRSVADIARALGLARQSVQRVADLLVTDGDATYEDNPRHRRARLLVPTAAGGAALRAIQERQARWADELGALAGEEQLAELVAGLDRVRELLGDPA